MMENSVIYLGNIYIRYEDKIDDGTVFLFNKETGEILEGNEQLYNILKIIDTPISIKRIADELKAIYVFEDYSMIMDKVKNIIDILKEKGFIKVVEEKGTGSNN